MKDVHELFVDVNFLQANFIAHGRAAAANVDAAAAHRCSPAQKAHSSQRGQAWQDLLLLLLIWMRRLLCLLLRSSYPCSFQSDGQKSLNMLLLAHSLFLPLSCSQ